MDNKKAPQRGTKDKLNLSQPTDKSNKILRPLKAIRTYCLGCCLYSKLEVKLCPTKDCPLYHYRLGHRPKGSVDMTPETMTEGQLNLFNDNGQNGSEMQC